MSNDKLIKTSEAAEQLGVHKNTVLNMLRNNELLGVRIGTKTIKVYQSSVDTVLSTGAYDNAS